MNRTVTLAIKGRQFFLICNAFLLFVTAAIAQTANITALTDQFCMGTRALRNLGCTLDDLTAKEALQNPANRWVLRNVVG